MMILIHPFTKEWNNLISILSVISRSSIFKNMTFSATTDPKKLFAYKWDWNLLYSLVLSILSA